MEIDALEGTLVRAFSDKNPTLRNNASPNPSAFFCTLVIQSKTSRAWLPGSSVSHVRAHEQSVLRGSLGHGSSNGSRVLHP